MKARRKSFIPLLEHLLAAKENSLKLSSLDASFARLEAARRGCCYLVIAKGPALRHNRHTSNSIARESAPSNLPQDEPSH
jgi:hypothetical protein